MWFRFLPSRNSASAASRSRVAECDRRGRGSGRGYLSELPKSRCLTPRTLGSGNEKSLPRYREVGFFLGLSPFFNRCGEGGIRTRGTVARTHDFQSCTFGRSVTSPGFGSRPYLGGARFGLLVHVACQRNKNLGGESGIRTHGRRKPTPDFESGSFGHSDTSPRRKLAASPQAVKTESPRKSSLSGESANSYGLS